jgi:hypothetical protein
MIFFLFFIEIFVPIEHVFKISTLAFIYMDYICFLLEFPSDIHQVSSMTFDISFDLSLKGWT